MAKKSPLHLLLKELQPVVDWHLFGIYLKLPKYELDKIQRQYFQTEGIERCKTEVLHLWLEGREKEDGVWEEVIEVLEKMKEEDLVRELRTKYFGQDAEHISHLPSNSVSTFLETEPVIIDRSVVGAFSNLEHKFAKIVADIQEHLEVSNVPLKQLHRFVVERLEDQSLPEPENIDHFFSIIRNHYCCLNYCLIDGIVKKFLPDSQIQAEMSSYEEELAEFCDSVHMNDLVDRIKVSISNHTGIQTVTIKLAGFWHKVTVRHFQKLIEHIFPGKRQHLSHIQVQSGCINVTWITPEANIPLLISLAQERVNFMRCVGVMKLVVGNTIIVEDGEDSSSANSAIYIAVIQGQEEAVEFLLDLGADPNTANIMGESLLIVASNESKLAIAEMLLRSGANISHCNVDGITALIAASDHKMFKLLLENNADVNQRTRSKETALMRASEKGEKEVVNILLEYKADPLIQNDNGWNALMFACAYGHVMIAKALVEAGAQIDVQHRNGWTALMFAASQGYVDVAQFLVELEANVDLQEHRGHTALMISIFEQNFDIARLLIKGNLNIQNKLGATALAVACTVQNSEIVHTILESGADPNLPLQNGWTPLMLACSRSCFAIPATLIAYGASINAQNCNGETALIIACSSGNTAIVEVLLGADANVNVATSEGHTALIRATCSGNVTILNLLLEIGADVQHSDSAGYTAVDIAYCYGYQEIVEILLKAGSTLRISSQNTSTQLITPSLLQQALTSSYQSIGLPPFEYGQPARECHHPISPSLFRHAIEHPLPPIGSLKYKEEEEDMETQP